MQNVIEIRNMQTAIHELFLIKCKPMTTLKAFEELSEGLNEYENWNIINNNTDFLGEINYRFITDNRQYTFKGIRYNILNNQSYDIW